MAADTYGFIGLGNMGAPMCANLVNAELDVRVFDAAGTSALAPDGSAVADSVADLAATTGTIFLSLPDGKIVQAVCAEIAAATPNQIRTVVDFSTTGPEAAGEVARMLDDAGIVFVDAPVNGGKAGTIAGTLNGHCLGTG